MKNFLIAIVLCTVTAKLTAANVNLSQSKSPDEIEAELEQAQRDFDLAQKMFIPWYTGPLITGSANNVPAGKNNIQVYLYYINQFAKYNEHRHSESIPTINTINPVLVLQRGLTDWLDVTVVPQWFCRWSQGRSSSQFGDTTVTFGFPILKQTMHTPAIRLTLGETFPSGKYQHLNPNKGGIDATGAGAYQTVIGLNFNKIFWWWKLHPLSVRLATSYAIADHKVHVKGFNNYGGGFGTDGNVSLGQTLNVDLGLEYSITQKWVLALDVAYTFSTHSTFSGFEGVTATGDPAANGAPSSDQLSLAPAIEYNVSDTGGFIGGVWFTVTGRNSGNFISGIISYTQLF